MTDLISKPSVSNDDLFQDLQDVITQMKVYLSTLTEISSKSDNHKKLVSKYRDEGEERQQMEFIYSKYLECYGAVQKEGKEGLASFEVSMKKFNKI